MYCVFEYMRTPVMIDRAGACAHAGSAVVRASPSAQAAPTTWATQKFLAPDQAPQQSE